MLPTEPAEIPVLIGRLFVSQGEIEGMIRTLLRASLVLQTHPLYLQDSEHGRALRESRIGLIALRELLEKATGEVW